MDPNHKATKVGIFVFTGLILIAVMLVNFSKGASWFHEYFRLQVMSRNVGGLKSGASVLLSGVPVGSVESTRLGPEGTNVIIVLRIFERYPIHRDARIEIAQSGFLGDQYVAITPLRNNLPLLNDGDMVSADPPFDVMDAARSIMIKLERLDPIVSNLDVAVKRISSELLSHQNLSNLSATIANARSVTEQAKFTMARVDQLVATNGPLLSTAVQQVSDVVSNVNGTVSHLEARLNVLQPGLQTIVSNTASSTSDIKDLIRTVKAGEGVVGGLLTDPAMREKVDSILLEYKTFGSNLSHFGIFYKPKAPRPTNSTPSLMRPRGIGN